MPMVLLIHVVQVAEEVGEILIHCRYGCRAGEKLEVDPNGVCVCVCVCVRKYTILFPYNMTLYSGITSLHSNILCIYSHYSR